jgi:two-component system chemotaxis sensor kinase CheA
MVGDGAAERVAHALEDTLRAAERAAAPLAPPLLDALFAGAELLERCIARAQAGAARPTSTSVLAELARGSALPPRRRATAADAPAVPRRSPAGRRAGARAVVHHFEFVPERGAHRARRRAWTRSARGCGSLGTLVDARPRMIEGGVAFDFRVSVPAGRAPDDAWAADGLRWSAAAAETHAPAPALAAEPAGDDARGTGHGEGGAPGTPVVGTTVTPPGTSAVRVDLARLDGVMRLVGDLVVSRSRLDDLLREAADGGAARVLDALEETNAAMERQLRRLRESVMRIRLVPSARCSSGCASRRATRSASPGSRSPSPSRGRPPRSTSSSSTACSSRCSISCATRSATASSARGTPRGRQVRRRPAHAAGARSGRPHPGRGRGRRRGDRRRRVATRARERGLLAPDETLTPDRLLTCSARRDSRRATRPT